MPRLDIFIRNASLATVIARALQHALVTHLRGHVVFLRRCTKSTKSRRATFLEKLGGLDRIAIEFDTASAVIYIRARPAFKAARASDALRSCQKPEMAL